MDCYGFREINENFMALLPLFHLPYAQYARRGNSDVKIKRMAGRMAEMRACRLSGGSYSLSLILYFLRNKNTHDRAWVLLCVS